MKVGLRLLVHDLLSPTDLFYAYGDLNFIVFILYLNNFSQLLRFHRNIFEIYSFITLAKRSEIHLF